MVSARRFVLGYNASSSRGGVDVDLAQSILVVVDRKSLDPSLEQPRAPSNMVDASTRERSFISDVLLNETANVVPCSAPDALQNKIASPSEPAFFAPT